MKSELVKEVWKPVLGYEGYEVSNFGRVKSLNYHRSGRYDFMSLCNDKRGYKMVCLRKNNKTLTLKVHRLVYEAFHGPIPDGMQVNHINEIKSDNSVWNLNLMTPKENNNYGNRNKFVSKPVEQLNLDYSFVRKYNSITECCFQNGFDIGHVSACCLGKRKSHKGFLFRFSDKD